MSRPAVKLAVKLILLAGLMTLTLMATKGAFGEAGTKKMHDNSVGVIMQQDNPLAYIEGNTVGFTNVDGGVNVRIQPRGVYQLYTQEILFCDIDDVAHKMGNAKGVLVLTYDRIAHRTIEGVGCHNLVYVDEVKGNDKLDF